jgi:hypothetical protein
MEWQYALPKIICDTPKQSNVVSTKSETLTGNTSMD